MNTSEDISQFIPESSYSPKKIPCRYGRGCTHIQDPFHRDRYDHPVVPILDGNVHKFL